ncbi:TerC family protein [Dyella sedimenti]|uniref:TerC family protein n=1 Tax=Dyella sedimenti TaxID=2919947 RepID=UPI001FA96A2C|nr:TerC family protein [Dyella sedimenti]
MELTGTDFLSGLLAIVLLDLVLAGDNAIVIALAARNLPRHIQRKAVLWGTMGAVAVRLALTAVVIYLLELPGLMLAGGLLLLPIAWKLLRQESRPPHEVDAAGNFWAAMRTIVVADALMGLDNVLAIAGAAKGHMLLVALGLAISVPLVVWGSSLILRLIERFPVIVYIGAAAIAWTSARMIAHDHWLAPWFDARPWAMYVLDALLVAGVCAGGWLARCSRSPRGDGGSKEH